MLKFLSMDVSSVFTVSFLSNLIIIICFTLIVSKPIKRNDINAVQASHMKPVARIGGLSVMLALVFATLPFLKTTSIWSSYSLLLLSTFPVFIVGFCEDLGYFSSPRMRFFAAVFSGAIFVSVFDLWLQRTDVPGLDFIMQWTIVGIGFSLFLAAGVNHAFNLIDGLNGLSSFTAVGAALSLAVISHQVGLDEHLHGLIVLVSAIAGFLVFNFPYGKIFLGDGGAYAIGHMLVWIAISILYASPSVTPLAILLIFFYPVVDTMLAIARRVYLGVPISHPDRLHFHQLVMRGVEGLIIGHKWKHVANPLAAIITLPFAFFPMIAGVLLAFDRNYAAAACFIFLTIFVITYLTIIKMTAQVDSSA